MCCTAIFDHSNTFLTKNERERENYWIDEEKKDVCDNLPGYVLLSLSMNAVDRDLTIHRQ